MVRGDVLDRRPFSRFSTTVHLFHLFTRLQRVSVKCTHMPSLQRLCTDLRRRAQPRQGGKVSSFLLRMDQMPVVTVHGSSEFLQTLPFSHQARGRLPAVSWGLRALARPGNLPVGELASSERREKQLENEQGAPAQPPTQPDTAFPDR